MSAKLRRESMPSGALGCVGTFVWNESTRSAVLIDPTDDPSTFLDFAKSNQLEVKRVLLTHAHFDHAAGACDAARAFGTVPVLHRDDWGLFHDMPKWGLRFGLQAKAPDLAPVPVEDGETLEIEEGFSFRVLHTPGHTQGQVAYVSDALNLAVVGDTLFAGSVGRTDLPGGDFPQLERSIRNKLYTLPEATVVVPGHGPETTIGAEKKGNAYVKA
jgi:hydroxyacylglutathione hydrolase